MEYRSTYYVTYTTRVCTDRTVAAQIANIEAYKLSSVLCDSLPDARRMQPQALLRPFTSTPK